MRDAVTDVLGTSGVFVDPVWRVEVALTALERRLLSTREVRRLAFVAHAGASSIATTQSYSRLEHSLGLLALVAHVTPEDRPARVAALLHDVGHLPFSHTLEGLAGLDHHDLGAARIRDLAPLLAEHGVDAEEVVAIDRGTRPSALHNARGAMRLDHLESFVRSGRSHGRTTQPPPETLRRLRVTGGCVDTDAVTGAYLATLVAAEAEAHLSEVNVVTNAVLRHLVSLLLARAEDGRAAELARLADDELWGVLLTAPQTRDRARRLREDPLHWRARPVAPGEPVDGDAIEHAVRRLYLDLPLVDGAPYRGTPPALPPVPVRFAVAARD